MTLPPVGLVRQYDTHRLIPAGYGEEGSGALARIAEDDRQLRDIFELADATNDRVLAENDLLPGIGVHELVFGVPNAWLVNAAFCHAHPLGGRFNAPDRGAWYTAFEVETAQAEVAFHKSVELGEVDWFEEELICDDYLSDFSAEFHDLRGDRHHADCLAPESYVASQTLAQALLDDGSLGLVYPSVRRLKGTCLACFRPALVMNVRKGAAYRFRWEGEPTPTVEQVDDPRPC